MKKIAKAKTGKSFGMLSVKAGIDKNPNPTAADRIAGAKMNAGKAKYGAKVAAKKPIKKAQNGDKTTMLPGITKKATSLRPMEMALGDDRKMSIDTVGYKSPARMRDETYNYTISDKSGKVIRKDRLTSQPGKTRQDIVSDMAKGLESGKYKRPTFKSGGKITAKKVVAKKSIKKAQDGTKMVVDGKEYESGAMLPEVTVTASRITDDAGKKKSGKGGKGRNLRDILEGNKIGRQMAKSYYGRGPLARRSPGSNRPIKPGSLRDRLRTRYEEGGEVKKMKTGGKCKYGC